MLAHSGEIGVEVQADECSPTGRTDPNRAEITASDIFATIRAGWRITLEYSEERFSVSANMTKHEALCWALIRNIHPKSLDKDLVSNDDAEAVIASAATLLLIQHGQDSPAEFRKLKDDLRGILPDEYRKWKKARS